ncbi:hypothetical protein KP509_16G070300 [Ceratopteris richardii]|uniref:DUF4408 domain-containing protein n=1 Tax=Ceratopteris richardii TaxID=49495 RepID=A0A8T2T3D5_CERRI|nr:hypothetical protein KP509_16G070300 [Ceratopteris richardii]
MACTNAMVALVCFSTIGIVVLDLPVHVAEIATSVLSAADIRSWFLRQTEPRLNSSTFSLLVLLFNLIVGGFLFLHSGLLARAPNPDSSTVRRNLFDVQEIHRGGDGIDNKKKKRSGKMTEQKVVLTDHSSPGGANTNKDDSDGALSASVAQAGRPALPGGRLFPTPMASTGEDPKTGRGRTRGDAQNQETLEVMNSGKKSRKKKKKSRSRDPPSTSRDDDNGGEAAEREGGEVDRKAEAFIAEFYEKMRMQRLASYNQRLGSV